jgi:hypothetical protein
MSETPVLTRQQIRALKRLGAKVFMQQNYGGEPRKMKRSMALVLVKRKGNNAPANKAAV